MNWHEWSEKAKNHDASDSLRPMKGQFLFPKSPEGERVVYLTGNSLGLQPKTVQEYVQQEIKDWARYGVEGHFRAKTPWFSYHEVVTESLTRVVGCEPHEVIAMNSLTVNLHLMMASFYRPTAQRYKILIMGQEFPSDYQAVCSQAELHGFRKEDAIVRVGPRDHEHTVRNEDILEKIDELKGSLALVLIGNPNFLTGQVFPMKKITEASHKVGAKVGFDLAHGVGNLDVQLNDVGCDFAVWCSYKYLNSGPGAIAGCYVNERHAKNKDLPRMAGWWGHNKETRFAMKPEFDPIPTAEGWQLSNPPIFQLASLRSSLEFFDQAGIQNLRQKSIQLTGYMKDLIKVAGGSELEVMTPEEPEFRGAQLSICIQDKESAQGLQKKLMDKGVVCDFREPNIVRAAPAPLYCSFQDVFHFVKTLSSVTGVGS